jgi:Domain of Unknown Function (DUF1206)
MNTTSTVQSNAREFTATPAFEAAARAGYVARGIVYALIGVLAFRIAEGVGTQPASQQGALREIAHQSFGHALLVLMAIGLAGYALWRAAQAFVGSTPEAGRHSALDRVAAVGSGIAYGAFCAIAISVLRGSSGGNSTSSARKATAGVLGWPAGRELVGAAGLILIGIGAYQAYLGLSRKFLEDSKTAQMGPTVRKAFTATGVVGLCSRAVAFGLMGIFALKAAVDFNARDAVGLDGALYRLTHHAYGTIALIVVACGLIAFGIYSLADARYRKI